MNEARIQRVRHDSQPTPDLTLIAPVIDHYRETGTGMMAVLQHTQEIYGYLPRRALEEISVETGVSLSQLYGVASFYDQFRLSPVGRFVDHRLPRHRLPRRRRAAHHRRLLRGARRRGRQDHQRPAVHAATVSCVGACALAPWSGWATTRPTAA